MNAPQMLLSEVVQRTLPHPGAAVQVRLDTHRARAVIVSISAILGAVLHRKQGERPNMPPQPPARPRLLAQHSHLGDSKQRPKEAADPDSVNEQHREAMGSQEGQRPFARTEPL